MLRFPWECCAAHAFTCLPACFVRPVDEARHRSLQLKRDDLSGISDADTSVGVQLDLSSSDTDGDSPFAHVDAGTGEVKDGPKQGTRARRPIASSRLQRQLYKTRSPSTPSWAEKVKMDKDLREGIPKV